MTNSELRGEISGALARGYCTERNKHKVLDCDLICDMVDEVMKVISEPLTQVEPKGKVIREMVEVEREDIELPNGKWAVLIYTDNTKEKCKWINKPHFDSLLKFYQENQPLPEKVTTDTQKGNDEDLNYGKDVGEEVCTCAFETGFDCPVHSAVDPDGNQEAGGTYCNCLICKGGKKVCKVFMQSSKPCLDNLSKPLPQPEKPKIEELDTHGLTHFNTAVVNKLNELIRAFNK
jgi:hypothetical protein